LSTKKTATNKELGELHKALAKRMQISLEAADAAQFLLDEFAEDLPTPVIDYLEKQSAASPALLTAVAKFLKDNDITCTIEDSEELGDLEKRLRDKRSRKKVGNVEYLDE
jgi:hypothetical protein